MSFHRIGLISDTHGLLRKEALRALEDTDLIIHAGDVGKPEILDVLKSVAPLVVVRGNIDEGDWAEALPLTAVAETPAANIYVLHNLRHLDLDPKAEGFQIVVSGHTHKPMHEFLRGVLYLNPGSAGPKRFNLPITLARLDVRKKPWRPEFVDLPAVP